MKERPRTLRLIRLALSCALAFVAIAWFVRSDAAFAQQAQSSAPEGDSASTTLTFLGNQNIPPMVYLDNGVPTGLIVDLVHALAKHIPQPIEVVAMDWPSAQALVASGTADALIQINETEERRKIYDFSAPLLESHFSIFVRANQVGVSGPISLRGLRVGVEQGGLPQKLLQQDPQIQLSVIPNFLDGFKSLTDGAIDAVVVDYRVGSYIIATNKLKGIKSVGDPIDTSYSAIAVKKGNIQLLDEINIALHDIKLDGTYQKVLDSWQSTNVVFQTQAQIANEIFYSIIAGLFVLLAITILWTITLRRSLAKTKRVEEAERKAEKYSEKLVSSASAMIVCLDTEGKVTLFNEAAERVAGYKREDVLGRDWFSLVVPRDRFPDVWKAFGEFQRQGKSIVGEFQNPILTKSGEERVIEWRNSDLTDDGHVIGTLSYGIDITERKKAEIELQRAAKEIQDLYDHAPCGYHSLDKDGVFVRVNDTELEWLGYRRDEVLGKMRFTDIVTADSQQTFKENFPKFKSTGSVRDLEFEIIRKDGSILPVLVSATAVNDKDGNYLMSRSTVYDITDRKKALDALRSSEDKYRSLIQKIQAAVVVHGADTRILSSNTVAQELLGLTEDQLLGKEAIDPAWQFFHESGESAKPEEYPINLVLSSRKPLRNYTLRVHRPTKSDDVWVLVNGDPVTNDKGEIVQAIITFVDITERKKAEVELQLSEAKLSTAFKASPDLMVITKKSDGTIIEANDGYSRLLGYTREESIGKTTSGLSIWANQSDREEFVSALQKYGEVHDLEVMLRRKDGTTVLCSDSARTFKLQDETYIFSVVRDITDRKRAEAELEKYNAELREAQRIGRIGNFDWDARTDDIIWSDEYYSIYGFDPKQKPPGYAEHLKAYSSESAARLDAAVQNSMKTGEPYVVDLEQVRSDGSKRWVTARGEVKRDGDGKIIGLRGTAQDITDRKKAEQELDRINRALRMLSGTNKALIHISDEMSLLEEINKVIIETGEYRMMWIGLAEQDPAKTVRPVAYAGLELEYLKTAKITWADDEYGRGPTGTAIRTGKTQISRDIDTDRSMTPWREEAKKRGYRSSIALPLVSDGKIFGALNVYSDKVDAFGGAETGILEELASDLAFGISILRMRKSVEERTKEVDQLKNKFISIVSHQLRTPLSVIRWNLETILNQKHGKVPTAQKETLQGTYEADLEIISRLNDLLIAMDIEEKKVLINTDVVDITDLLRSICEEKLQPSRLKGIACEIVAPEKPLPAMKTDAEKVRDVVARLIDNAIVYTHEKGRITTRFFLKGHSVRFEISDTGIGIPLSEQAHIFERFRRGWNASQMRPDASGLSLYIAKHYIEALQGTIGFSSKEKEGTTFWFELPIV